MIVYITKTFRKNSFYIMWNLNLKFECVHFPPLAHLTPLSPVYIAGLSLLFCFSHLYINPRFIFVFAAIHQTMVAGREVSAATAVRMMMVMMKYSRHRWAGRSPGRSPQQLLWTLVCRWPKTSSLCYIYWLVAASSFGKKVPVPIFPFRVSYSL